MAIRGREGEAFSPLTFTLALRHTRLQQPSHLLSSPPLSSETQESKLSFYRVVFLQKKSGVSCSIAPLSHLCLPRSPDAPSLALK